MRIINSKWSIDKDKKILDILDIADLKIKREIGYKNFQKCYLLIIKTNETPFEFATESFWWNSKDKKKDIIKMLKDKIEKNPDLIISDLQYIESRETTFD